MISLSEIQPSGGDLVSQVEEIFSPTGILSRAKNFEFRPQQQEMAVAVARALQNREHLAVEAGTGVGKSLAYLIPAILFAVAQKKKADRFHAHDQFAGAAYRKGFADARRRAWRAAGAGEIHLRDAEGPRQLSLHAPPAKSHAAERQSVHLLRGGGIAAHLRVVEGNQGRQPVGFRIRAGPESVGASLFRTRVVFAENVRASVGFCQGPRPLFLPARAEPHLVRRRRDFEPHALFHAAGRRGRGTWKAAFCSKTISWFSTRRTRWKAWRRGTSA